METAAESASLEDALKKYAIETTYGELTGQQKDQLADYCNLLWEWNQRLNLTRHVTWDRFVSRDLVDTLELSRLLGPEETVLDVGTGGGVPGIPLAILRPDLVIGLCESVVKKARAVQGILVEMGMEMTFFEGRAEAALQDYEFDTLFCRAVGPLWKILFWFQHEWDSIGRILAIKGPSWVEERKEARHRGLLRDLELRRAATYPLADTDSDSVILSITPKHRATGDSE